MTGAQAVERLRAALDQRDVLFEVERIVRKHEGVTLADVLAHGGEKPIRQARIEVFLYLKDDAGLSHQTLADLFARERCTIAHMIRYHRDEEFAARRRGEASASQRRSEDALRAVIRSICPKETLSLADRALAARRGGLSAEALGLGAA